MSRIRRALLALLLAALSPFGTAATWTLVQSPHNYCGAGTACTVTASSTASGNLLVLVSSAWQNTNPSTAPSYQSATGDSFTHCPASYLSVNTTLNVKYQSVDCVYITSSTGGSTSFTFTWNKSQADQDVWLLEYHLSAGAIAYDNGNTLSANGNNPTGPTLTLSGINDIVVQFGSFGGNCLAITSPYTDPFLAESNTVAGCVGGAMNVASYSIPTWTSANNLDALGVVAFKPAPIAAKTCTLSTMGAGPC